MELNPVIIGIAGGTGSGKSTLAENIQKEFNQKITMLSHDYYYKSHSDIPFEERRALDIYYVMNWSLMMDAQIFFKTIATVLKRDGAK